MKSEYSTDDGKPLRMSPGIYALFFRANFAAVNDELTWLRDHPVAPATKDVPHQPGRLTSVHLLLSDASGDSATLEWRGAKLQIHHDRNDRVMTNHSP